MLEKATAASAIYAIYTIYICIYLYRLIRSHVAFVMNISDQPLYGVYKAVYNLESFYNDQGNFFLEL